MIESRLGTVRLRRGLAPVADALRRKPCNIGYLGGSVTAQRAGYVPALQSLLCEATRQSHASTVAALGGVGSISGALLMDDLFRGRRPDVCFVEFTTGDRAGYTPPPLAGAAVEGILRKLIRVGVQPVILHLFRSEPPSPSSDAVMASYERVAAHYGVPTIDIAARWARDGEWSARSYLKDVVHLTEAGASACASQILEAVMAGTEGSGCDEAQAGRPPLHENAYDATRVVPVDPAMVRDGARVARRLFRFNYPLLDIEPLNELNVESEKGIIGLLVVVGPRAGTIEVADPSGKRRYALFDEYCHYERLTTIILGRDGGEARRLRIQLTLDPVDTAICRAPVSPIPPGERRFSIAGLLTRA